MRLTVSCHGALVGQAGECVGGGAEFGEREVAQVGEHRCSLRDRFAQGRRLVFVHRLVVLDEDRADHLAADEQRLAGGFAPGLAAHLAPGEGLAGLGPRCGRARTARPGTSEAWRPFKDVVEDASPRAPRYVASRRSALLLRFSTTTLLPGDRAFDLPPEQVVRDLLAVGHLQRVDELALDLLVLGAYGSALDHLVQRTAEYGELVGAARGEPLAEIARSRPRRELRVAPDPRHDVASQQQHAADPEGECAECDRQDDQPVGVVGPNRLRVTRPACARLQSSLGLGDRAQRVEDSANLAIRRFAPFAPPVPMFCELKTPVSRSATNCAQPCDEPLHPSALRRSVVGVKRSELASPSSTGGTIV